jgi:hypothetical protein
MPIPANMTFAGENTCHINMSVHISDKFMQRRTKPTPAATVEESA